MELIRYLHNLQGHHQGCVVTIGNFDGVHLGHQAVIAQLRGYAGQLGLPAVVMIFEPQPLEFFSTEMAPSRLTDLRDKIEWLREHGIDRVICLRFHGGLASLTAEQFVERLLVDGLGAELIVVGDDFRFGQGRQGDFQLLKRLGGRYGFDVKATDTLITDGIRISSSRIRECLNGGRLDEAAALLGRPYSISGRVIHGDKRGRELGFPTANIRLKRAKSPLLGVYAVRVLGLDGKIHKAVANIGTRPMFDGGRLLLEVHLLDFSKEIYGEHLHVEFLKRLREESKFDTLEILRAQIASDIDEARSFFSGMDVVEN